MNILKDMIDERASNYKIREVLAEIAEFYLCLIRQGKNIEGLQNAADLIHNIPRALVSDTFLRFFLQSGRVDEIPEEVVSHAIVCLDAKHRMEESLVNKVL